MLLLRQHKRTPGTRILVTMFNYYIVNMIEITVFYKQVCYWPQVATHGSYHRLVLNSASRY
jgi:hypothetical protein